MKRIEFKTLGGRIAYAMFYSLFIIVPILFLVCIIYFSSVDSGEGLISFSKEENFMWAVWVFMPLFLSVNTLLVSINYIICRITKTVETRLMDMVFHALSFILAIPGLIGIFQLVAYGAFKGFFQDLYMLGFLVLPLWLLYAVCRIVLKIPKKIKESK